MDKEKIVDSIDRDEVSDEIYYTLEKWQGKTWELMELTDELIKQNQKLIEAIEDTLLFMEDAEQNYGYDLSNEIYTLEKALDEVDAQKE